VINLASKSAIEVIVYQCIYCGKKRRLVIPRTFKPSKSSDSVGLIDYVDVHRCENDELTAIICFVDANSAVRSQVKIKATHAGYIAERDFTKEKKEDPFAILGIPSPTKKEFIDVNIESKNFKARNIEGFQIKDRIRKKIYYFGKQGKGQALPTKSRLGFIDITLFLSKKVADQLYKEWEKGLKKDKRRTFPYTTTRKWVQHLADEMESIIRLDEKMLPYIAEYIDKHITTEPNEQRLIELDLLLNLTISIPWTKRDKYEQLGDVIQELFPNKPVKELADIVMSVASCIDNNEKTLLDIYNLVSKRVPLSEFLDIFGVLVAKGYVNLTKLQFTSY